VRCLLLRERQARKRAQDEARRAEFLSEAGRVLPSSLDRARTLHELTRLALPQLGDWCLVRVLGDDGIVRTEAAAHVEAKKVARVLQLATTRAADIPFERSMLSHMVEGRSVFFNGEPPYSEAYLKLVPLTLGPYREKILEMVREVGATSFMMVPLAARGRVFGTMTFVSARPERRYGPDDVGLAEGFAARAAVAVDNANIHRETERALKAREEFLMIAAHELRTPLTSLYLAVQALQKRTGPAGQAKAEDALLGAVQRGTVRLVGLVDELLDVSRVTVGLPTPERQDVDLREIVREVVEQLGNALEQAGCKVHRTTLGQTNGSWDRRWLVRIVSNLVSNAAKFGAGHPIDVELLGREDTVRLTVRDHGIGISQEEQARIFERFERAVSIREYGGFGLGLWIVRRMVEALGGVVHVESRPAEGATFMVDLPRHAVPRGLRTAC
jgi:signal transduction histidine kinase